MSERPLQGLKVLDLSRLLPGPYLSLVLADLGADVIKVEAPGTGDLARWVPPQYAGMSAQFIALNRGKRSVSINLKKPGGTDVLQRLCANADVLIESFRPGVMDRLGVGYDALSAVNPGLVFIALSGYGQTGPYRDKAGHDLNYAALGGTLGMTGVEGGPPVMAGVQIADISGGLYGVVGVLSAIYARQNTGKGRFIDLALADSALSFNVMTLAHALNANEDLPRGTEQLSGGAAYYQVYECRDGEFFSVGALEPKFFQAFCDAVEKPEWKSRQMGNDAELKVEISALFKTRTRAEWADLFEKVDACCEPVLSLLETPDHPQHIARDNFFELEQPGMNVPFKHHRTPLMDASELDSIRPAPGLGEHTREVLGESGFGSDEIETLINSGTIKT